MASQSRIDPLEDSSSNSQRMIARSTIYCTPEDCYIAILGTTGSGKSNFISKCTTEPPLQDGEGLRSVTRNVALHSTIRNGRTVRLIDTPGLDDTDCSDVETVKLIAFWLLEASRQGLRLDGVVGMYDISCPRFQGTHSRALKIFKAICGHESYPWVVMVATRCDEISSRTLDERLAWLRDDPSKWADILQGGGSVARYQNSAESALRIIDHLQSKNSKLAPRLVQEMAVEGKTLAASSVGQVLYAHHLRATEDLERQIQEVSSSLVQELSNRDISLRRETNDSLRTLHDLLASQNKALYALQINTSSLVSSISDAFTNQSMRLDKIGRAAESQISVMQQDIHRLRQEQEAYHQYQLANQAVTYLQFQALLARQSTVMDAQQSACIASLEKRVELESLRRTEALRASTATCPHREVSAHEAGSRVANVVGAAAGVGSFALAATTALCTVM